MTNRTRELLARDRIRFKHRLEYAAFSAVLAAADRLSSERALRLGGALGRLGHPLGIKRDIVADNLRTAFPDHSEEWRERIARASWEHLGRETTMMLRLATMSRDELIERTTTVAADEALDTLRAGRGVIVVAGHLGNWEIGAAMMAVRGQPVDVIAKRAANPLFYQRILAVRERLGVGVIDFQGATRHALRSLRAGRAVAFAADQHAGRAGLWVPFFGRLASTYRGPALMALRTGAPIYLSIPIRRADGTYELTLERIDVPLSGDTEADELRVTEAYSRRLEAAVRRFPEQYVWQHRRWREPPASVRAAPVEGGGAGTEGRPGGTEQG